MLLTKEKADEEFKQNIEQIKDIYEYFLAFIDNPDSKAEENFNNLVTIISKHCIERNKEAFNHFIGILVDISNNHHRQPGFFDKLERIIIKYENSIKANNSNIEIYEQFESNKRLLYFVIKEKIMAIEPKIKELIDNKLEQNGIKYSDYFLPEIKKSDNDKNDLKEEDENIKYYLSHLDEYELARQNGENETYICKLIRQDSIEEFISYVNQKSISLSSKINPSIFETNSFLNDKEPTLIEYATFFGSIQIFQYLYLNKVEVNDSIWLYSIHSNNSDLLRNYIEHNLIKPSDELCEKVFKKCIKCHHNDIARYIEDNYIDDNQVNKQNEQITFEERVIDEAFKYHNYSFFTNTFDQSYIFFYFYKYNYSNIVSLLNKSRKDIIEKKII